MAKETVFVIKGCTKSTPIDAKCETSKFDEEIMDVIVENKVGSDGRVYPVKSVVKKRPSDNVKNYKWQDFSLENLMAIGAADLLRPSKLNDIDIDDAIGQVAHLDEMVAQQQVSVENNNE